MRKGFDGLSGLVHSELGRRPVSGEVFIFVNHQRDKIKMLHWEHRVDLCYTTSGLSVELLNCQLWKDQ